MGVIALYLFILLVIILVFGSTLYASFSAAPWLPVFKKDIEEIIKLADIKEDDVVIDLGSGDGRIVIALANITGARRIIGYELSLLFYVVSRLRVLFLGLSQRIDLCYGNFFRRSLSSADVIFCFLTPRAMKELKYKFSRELKPGAKIISYSFKIPGWCPVKREQKDDSRMPIYKYVVGESDIGVKDSGERSGIDWF